MPLFEIIIAKLLVLTDAILEIFVVAPTNGSQVLLGNCGTVVTWQSNGLTGCGTALVGQLGGLINQTIGLLTGAISALSVTQS